MKLTFIMAAALLPGLLLAGCSKEDPKSYSKVDYNKDGKIIFEELIVVFPDLTVEEFLLADADNNGVLSEREYNRFRQARDAGKKLDASAPPLAPEPAKNAEPTKPAEPAKAAEPAKPVEQAKPAEPAKAAEPAKPTDPAPAPAAAPQTPAAPAPQAPASPVPPAPEPVAEVVEMVVAEVAAAKAPTAPAAAAATSYTVARGDNLVRIAKKFGLTTQELMAANGLQNADRVDAGKVLTIPGPGQGGPAAARSEVKPAVAAFVADYFAKSSAADVTALVDLYGESVDYYKKGKAGSDVVRQDKAAYFERWPERSYKTAAPTVAELSGGDVKVTIPVDYVVKRADKTVRGKATFTLLLRPAGGSYRIIGEQSAVLEHK